MPLDVASNVSNDAVLNWLRQYQQQKRRCDEENGTLRNIIKRAKSDGINTKAMIRTAHAVKLDPESVRQDLRDEVHYLTLRGIEIEREALFAWSTDRSEQSHAEDRLWDAEDQGYKAGHGGKKLEDNPFEEGSEFARVWADQWQRGQAAIAREMGPGAKPASTSRARPARKAAAATGDTPKPARRSRDVSAVPGRKAAARPRPAVHH